MQKVYHSELSFTVTGDNAEQIAKRMQDFMSLIKSEGITDIAITDTTQIDGDGIEDESGLTIDEIINSCADTKRFISVSEAAEIRRRYNQGCIDNPGCSWEIVVEILADEVIDNREN